MVVLYIHSYFVVLEDMGRSGVPVVERGKVGAGSTMREHYFHAELYFREPYANNVVRVKLCWFLYHVLPMENVSTKWS